MAILTSALSWPVRKEFSCNQWADTAAICTCSMHGQYCPVMLQLPMPAACAPHTTFRARACTACPWTTQQLRLCALGVVCGLGTTQQWLAPWSVPAACRSSSAGRHLRFRPVPAACLQEQAAAQCPVLPAACLHRSVFAACSLPAGTGCIPLPLLPAACAPRSACTASPWMMFRC